MSKFALISASLFLMSRFAFLQPDPVVIQFVEAQPIWEHMVWDTSYYDIGAPQPDINKYTVVNPYKSFRFNDDLFVLSICQNHRLERFGYVLERLDIATGHVIWQNFNTYFNGGVQDFYKELYLRPDGNLEMIGVKRHGPYTEMFPGAWDLGARPSNYIRKVFDYNTGELLEAVAGQESFHTFLPHSPVFYPVVFDTSYLAINVSGAYLEDSTLTLGYFFNLLDKHHSLDSNITASSVLYETADTFTYFSFGQPVYTHKINDSTIMGLLIKDKLHPEITKAQMIWIDVRDPGNVKVLKRLNIDEYLAPERKFLYFKFHHIKDLVFINQPYYNPLLQKNVTYLTCLNTDGALVHYFPVCQDDGYSYVDIFPFYVTDTFVYYAAFPSRKGGFGGDILKLDRGSDDFEYISSLTSAVPDEDFTRQLEVVKMYDDGIFILGAYTKKNGPVQNTAVKFYAFRAEDLGIDLSTSVVEKPSPMKVQTWPNPSTGIVNLGWGERFSGIAFVHDILGRTVGKYVIHDADRFEITLAENAPGMYFITLFDKHHEVRYAGKVAFYP